MIELYRRSFGLFFGYFPFFAIMAALFVAMDHFGPEGGTSEAIVDIFIAFYCHKLLLAKEPISKKWIWTGWFAKTEQENPLAGKIWPFFWRAGVFYLIYSAIAMALVLLIFVLLDGEGAGRSQSVAMIASVLASPVLVPLLALLGTVMPAVIVGEDASLARAFRRGRKTFWITMLRFAFGPCLVSLVQILIATLMVLSGYTKAPVPSLLFALINIFITCLSIAALCLAYEEAELQLASTTSD